MMVVPRITLVLLVPLVTCASIDTSSLVSLDQPAMEAFLKPFRESLLHTIAVTWNHTIGDSARLHVQMQSCSDKIKASVGTCKTCTAAACQSEAAALQHSATFTDYLKLASTLINPYTYLKEPLNEVGDKFGDLVDLLGSGSYSFIDSMASLGQSVGGAFTAAFHGVETGFNTVKGTVVDTSDLVTGGITDVANSIGHGFTDGIQSAGHALQTAGQTILNGIGSIFGRRAVTDLDPRLRACMEKCSSCDALLITNQRNMITSEVQPESGTYFLYTLLKNGVFLPNEVCGAAVVNFNDTVRSTVTTVKGIYATVSDPAHPIIAKIELDPSSLAGVTYSRVYVTAVIHGRYVRYLSHVQYDMMNVATSAHQLAAEYWQIWTSMN